MAKQPRVLMVEDHPDIADLYQLKLQLEGYRDAEATRDLLVVVFSEDDNPKLIEEAKRLSAAAHLIKAHLLPSRLSDTIGDVLRNRGRFIMNGNGNGNGHKAQRAS